MVENKNAGKDPFGFTVNNGGTTNDHIFILKYEEVNNIKYVSDVASDWWTRTPDNWGQLLLRHGVGLGIETWYKRYK